MAEAKLLVGGQSNQSRQTRTGRGLSRGGGGGHKLPVGDVEGKGRHGKGDNGSTQGPNDTVEGTIEGKCDAHKPAQQSCTTSITKSAVHAMQSLGLHTYGVMLRRLSWDS